MSNNKMAIEKMRFWSTQARESVIHYEHKEYGYNYRMSNVCAAIGRGQLEFLPIKLMIRRKNHITYLKAVEGLLVHIKRTTEKGHSNYWLNLLYVDSDKITALEIITALHNKLIESRPSLKPMHMQPVFKETVFVGVEKVYHRSFDAIGEPSIVDEVIYNHTLCLPSGDTLTEEEIREIVYEVIECLKNCDKLYPGHI